MGLLASELPVLMYADVAKELRRSDRVTVNCHLTYSGIQDDTLIIGEGTAIDLSKEGVGIQGNQEVKPGMHLTLCLALPDYEGPLLIDEVRVVWAKGGRFGVESVRIDKRSRLRLDHFLLFKKLNPPQNQQRVSVRVKL
ncbi:MAG: PilZ domain-containing protein [Nitrospira sp.]